MKKALLPFFLFSIAITAIAQGTTCNLTAIQSAMTAMGYKQLNVVGQPCSVYFINDTNTLLYDTAEAKALSVGGHLVVLNDSTESVNVLQGLTAGGYISGIGSGRMVWLGVKRVSTANPQFYTLDSSTGSFTPGPATPTLYQNWALGEPNNNLYQSSPGCIFGANNYQCINGEQCVQFYTNGMWNDISCDEIMIPVIEINICPQVTVSNDTVVCANSPVQLLAEALPHRGTAPYTFSWTPGNSVGSSLMDTPAITTTHIITLTDRWGCTAVDTQITHIQTVAINGVGPFCSGDSITLSAFDSVFAFYLWSTGATTSSIVVKQGGAYSVTAVTTNGCSVSASDSVTMLASAVPTINLTVSDTAVCEGEQLTFTASYTLGGSTPALLWKKNGVSTGFTGNPYSADSLVDGDEISVQLTSNATCANPAVVESPRVIVVVQPVPLAPSISLSGNVLVSSILNGNQWYLDSNLILGAINQNYTPTQTGNYSVIVTSLYDCSSPMSSSFYYRVTDIAETDADYLNVFPNPATSYLTIDVNGLQVDKLTVSDIQGRILHIENRPSAKTVDISSLKQGIYFAEVVVAGKTMRVKWTKM
jgi:hypothetical protein